MSPALKAMRELPLPPREPSPTERRSRLGDIDGERLKREGPAWASGVGDRAGGLNDAAAAAPEGSPLLGGVPGSADGCEGTADAEAGARGGTAAYCSCDRTAAGAARPASSVAGRSGCSGGCEPAAQVVGDILREEQWHHHQGGEEGRETRSKPFLLRCPCAWARNGRCRMESMSYDVLYGILNTSGSPARNLLSPLFVRLDGRQHWRGYGS